MKLETFDELALQALIRGDKTELERLHTLANRQMNGGPCPECDDKGPHMDNGARRVTELTWCCNKCGMQWDAIQEAP